MTQSKKIKVLGITGGVGAGKSTVLDYLKRRYGARVLQCDEAAKILQEPGGSCYRPVAELFGEDVLGRDGRFDRGKIAAIVFTQEEFLEKLNAIVHPAVKKYVEKEIQKERDLLKTSRGYSEEKITRMMSAQRTEGYFRKYCQFAVDNSSDNVENTYEQIDEGLKTHGFL